MSLICRRCQILFIQAVSLVFLFGCEPPQETGDALSISSNPTGISLRSITFGDGLYIAVGPGGTIIRSHDALSWSASETLLDADLEFVVYANHTFLALGTETTTQELPTSTSSTTDTAVATGTETVTAAPQTVSISKRVLYLSGVGLDWNRIDIEIPVDVTSLVAANGRFFMLGHNGMLMSSSNGSNWTTHSLNTLNTLYDITFGNRYFVAIGERNTIVTSQDAESWHVRQEVNIVGPPSLRHVVHGNNLFVGVDSGATFLNTSFSFDALFWESQNIVELSSLMRVHDIKFGAGRFILLGEGICLHADVECPKKGMIAISSDAENWRSYDLGDELLYGITFGVERFVIVGENGFIAYSGNSLNSRGEINWKTNSDTTPDERE